MESGNTVFFFFFFGCACGMQVSMMTRVGLTEFLFIYFSAAFFYGDTNKML